MDRPLLPAHAPGEPSAWAQTLYAFLVEKGSRSGSRRTMESYGRIAVAVIRGHHARPSAFAWRPCLGARDRAFGQGPLCGDYRCAHLGRCRPEVLRLTAGDISVEGDRVLYAYTGKGGKRGLRELPRPAYDAIAVTLADAGRSLGTMAPGESLWQAGARPVGVSSTTFYGRFRRYLAAAGLAPTGLHVLRHTAARLRRDAGESIEEISAFLDHSSLAVTTVYLRRMEGTDDNSWRPVADAIGA